MDKFLLKLFSLIIIIISVVLILFSTEMIADVSILKQVGIWLTDNKYVGLCIGGVFALLGLVGLFSASDSSENIKSGLAIKTEKGTVYITKDTFESIILAVTRNFAELRNVKVDIQMNEYGIVANVYTMILPDTVVPTLTTKLQESIKSSILKQTTVEIKEANVKIKGVYLEPQKK
jgi:uncharacterized alkaline shock family protein YloU